MPGKTDELRRFLKVESIDALQMSDGKLFYAAGPATQNARLPRQSLIRGMMRSPWATDRRALRLGTYVTETHKSIM